MSAAPVALIIAVGMAVTSEQAIGIARGQWPEGGEMAGVAWHVQRLDRPGTAYYLVVLSQGDRAAAVVTIESETGRVGSKAGLQSTSPVQVDARRARQLAGGDESADAALVWTPSQISRSQLYPFWRVRVGERWRYVSQQAATFDILTTTGPGGAAR